MNKTNNYTRLSSLLTSFIGLVWLANGLLCKVMDLVPRHQQIVGAILGQEHQRFLTVLIGLSEIGMAVWVWSRYKSKLNALVQMSIVAFMNILEFTLVPNLLLWGRLNIVFASAFIVLVFYNAFILNPKPE